MKSLDVLSAPLPVAEPAGRGAGVSPQFARLILRASTQYFSPVSLERSMLSEADLKSPAALRNASSLLPMTNCESKVCTDTMEGGLETIVAESDEGDNSVKAGPVEV